MSESKKRSKNPDQDKHEELKRHFDSSMSFSDRTIHITGSIGGEVDFDYIDIVMSALERDSRKAITIKINSPGGSVYEALAIVGRITSSPCRIITEGYGCIMSAATLILACGNKRRMSQYATFMFHASSYRVDGNHDSIMQEVAQMEREESQWAEWMGQLTNLSSEEWRKKSKNKNYYLTAEECEDHGIVDEVF